MNRACQMWPSHKIPCLGNGRVQTVLNHDEAQFYFAHVPLVPGKSTNRILIPTVCLDVVDQAEEGTLTVELALREHFRRSRQDDSDPSVLLLVRLDHQNFKDLSWLDDLKLTRLQ